MNQIYMTSDLHFAHDKFFLYKPRGFESVEQMNRAIVRNWNKIIDENDTIYVLGDIMLNNNEDGIYYWNLLKGHKKIIIGNHDTDAKLKLLSACPNTEIIGYATVIKYKKINFYLSHYPTITSNYDEKHFNQHVINCFGHIHSKEKFYDNIPYLFNVSLDSNNNTPVEIEEIIEQCRNKNLEVNNDK